MQGHDILLDYSAAKEQPTTALGEGPAMHRFIHRENVKHYKELLGRTTTEAERQRILKLLAEEEAEASANPPPKEKTKTNKAASVKVLFHSALKKPVS
jgi:hypothetical protein